jgi:hypothetical protein
MADILFIIPGYSDEDFSFLPLRNLLDSEGLYEKKNIYSIEYASLNDQADFRDFADRLDDIYNENFSGQRVDVLAHSTGSLVVRAWLYLRRMRQRVRDQAIDLPVEHLFLFAPANFGSDLAKLGQSPLNALKVTFTKFNKKNTLIGNQKPFETGRKVLQGLEPASPTQWELSMADLHGLKRNAYFGEHDETGLACYPFVFAAGRFFQGLESIIVRELQKDSTDSTVRIAGTSLNTQKCKLRASDSSVTWTKEYKFSDIAFAIFGNYDHCGIINDNGNSQLKKPKEVSDEDWQNQNPQLPGDWEPLELLRKAKNVATVGEYESLATEFRRVTDDYTETNTGGVYQQFFFKIIDDTSLEVTDYFIRFLVYDLQKDVNESDKDLTKQFRESFGSNTEFYIHSVKPEYRVLMIDIKSVTEFVAQKLQGQKQVKMEVIAQSPYFGVEFSKMEFVIYDSNQQEQYSFFYRHTTTLVEIVLDRKVDKIILDRGSFTQGSG